MGMLLQSSGVPETEFSSSHRVALRCDGASLVARQGRKEVGERVEWTMMQPLSTGFTHHIHSPYSLLPQVRPWTAPYNTTCAATTEKGKPLSSPSHIPGHFCSFLGQAQEAWEKKGGPGWCSSQALLFTARPGPGSLTRIDAEGFQHWSCRSLASCVSEQTAAY